MNSVTKGCLGRDSFRCRSCASRNNLTAHHVVFRSHQGPDTLDNLLTLCQACHMGLHNGKLLIHVVQKLPDNLVVQFERINGWKPQ